MHETDLSAIASRIFRLISSAFRQSRFGAKLTNPGGGFYLTEFALSSLAVPNSTTMQLSSARRV